MKKYLYTFLFSSLFASEAQQSFWETYTAALRGDKVAQFQTGVIYERGIGIEQNQAQAALWYERAAQQGHVDAQYNIAIMYASGYGVAVDEGLAMMWLARAAKQKDPEARRLLLKIIDGDLDSDKQEDKGKSALPSDIVSITPTVLYSKENASVCEGENLCSEYKIPMIFTSVNKRGEYYKISGIVNKKGWKKYLKEGWIHENNIDHKK